MILLLEEAAAAAPTDHVAVVTPEGSLSYGALLDDARRVAAGLQRRGVTRFAVVESDAAWVIRLLAGAAIAGAEPCQYQADTAPGEFAEQAPALGHEVVVTQRRDLDGPLRGDPPRRAHRQPPSAPTTAVPADGAQPIMIRTTGTTGLPKAARHDWRVLGKTVARSVPCPTSAGSWPTARTSSPASRCCCTSWRAGPRWWRRSRVNPRMGCGRSSTTASPA